MSLLGSTGSGGSGGPGGPGGSDPPKKGKKGRGLIVDKCDQCRKDRKGCDYTKGEWCARCTEKAVGGRAWKCTTNGQPTGPSPPPGENNKAGCRRCFDDAMPCSWRQNRPDDMPCARCFMRRFHCINMDGVEVELQTDRYIDPNVYGYAVLGQQPPAAGPAGRVAFAVAGAAEPPGLAPNWRKRNISMVEGADEEGDDDDDGGGDDGEGDGEGGPSKRPAKKARMIGWKRRLDQLGPNYRPQKCHMCQKNGHTNCDAAIHVSDPTLDWGCHRCAHWGLVCIKAEVGVQYEPSRVLPTNPDKAGTGGLKMTLKFTACRNCRENNLYCERQRPCSTCTQSHIQCDPSRPDGYRGRHNTFLSGTARGEDKPRYYLAMGYSARGIGHLRTEGPEVVGPPVLLQDNGAGVEGPRTFQPREPDADGVYRWNRGKEAPPYGSQLPRSGQRVGVGPEGLSLVAAAPAAAPAPAPVAPNPTGLFKWPAPPAPPPPLYPDPLLADFPLDPALDFPLDSAVPGLHVDAGLRDPAVDPALFNLPLPTHASHGDNPLQAPPGLESTGNFPWDPAEAPASIPWDDLVDFGNDDPVADQPQQVLGGAAEAAEAVTGGIGGGGAGGGDSAFQSMQFLHQGFGVPLLPDLNPMLVPMLQAPEPNPVDSLVTFGPLQQRYNLAVFPAGNRTRRLSVGPSTTLLGPRMLAPADGVVIRPSDGRNMTSLYPQMAVPLPLATISLGRTRVPRDLHEDGVGLAPAQTCAEPPQVAAPQLAGVCGRPIDNTFCEDRDHSADHMWGVCERCNDESRERFLNANYGLWSIVDTLAMRMYSCAPCVENGAVSRAAFERSGLRVWGYGEEEGRPSAADAHGSGGFMGVPWEMSGCGDCVKLFGPHRSLCNDHRILRAAAVTMQVQMMREWVLTYFGSYVCPFCMQNACMDTTQFVGSQGTKLDRKAWQCLACNAAVVKDGADAELELDGRVGWLVDIGRFAAIRATNFAAAPAAAAAY